MSKTHALSFCSVDHNQKFIAIVSEDFCLRFFDFWELIEESSPTEGEIKPFFKFTSRAQITSAKVDSFNGKVYIASGEGVFFVLNFGGDIIFQSPIEAAVSQIDMIRPLNSLVLGLVNGKVRIVNWGLEKSNSKVLEVQAKSLEKKKENDNFTFRAGPNESEIIWTASSSKIEGIFADNEAKKVFVASVEGISVWDFKGNLLKKEKLEGSPNNMLSFLTDSEMFIQKSEELPVFAFKKLKSENPQKILLLKNTEISKKKKEKGEEKMDLAAFEEAYAKFRGASEKQIEEKEEEKEEKVGAKEKELREKLIKKIISLERQLEAKK